MLPRSFVVTERSVASFIIGIHHDRSVSSMQFNQASGISMTAMTICSKIGLEVVCRHVALFID